MRNCVFVFVYLYFFNHIVLRLVLIKIKYVAKLLSKLELRRVFHSILFNSLLSILREVKEECGVDVALSLRKAGLLEYTFEGENLFREFHVFEADGFTGIPVESDGEIINWSEISNVTTLKIIRLGSSRSC